MANKLDGNFYLVLKKKNWMSLTGRLTSGKPSSLKAGEVAIKLDVSVPAALFSTPQYQAKVVIPEDAVTAPVIDTLVLDNVRDIIEQQTGLSISLSLVDPK